MKTEVENEVESNPCSQCKGMCCRYIAIAVETPKTRRDYDDLRWYLCHENISVFLEKDKWYVMVKNTCRHLDQATNLCGIYQTRPRICREFPPVQCDFRSDEYGHDLHFKNDKELEEYIHIKFDNNKIPK